MFETKSFTSLYNDLTTTNSSSKKCNQILAKMKPNKLNHYFGQKHIIGPNTLLNNLMQSSIIPSMILWGPSGCGKASLVNVIIKEIEKLSNSLIKLIELSAATTGIKDVKQAVVEAQTLSKQNIRTVVFMDKIHKFNKFQQDIFLPHVEAGTFILIGSTTENPSSTLNLALLSRCRIFDLKKLQKDDLISLLCKAVKVLMGEVILNIDEPREDNFTITFLIEKNVIDWLAEVCDGNAKAALIGLEMSVENLLSNTNRIHLSKSDIECCLNTTPMANNIKSDNLHDMHSALHHSIIAEDDNAALYWLARIMETGEDPVYIAKRLIKIASEDIEYDDEDALSIAVHTMHACQMIGMPESDVILAQCVVYLSRAEKSKEILNALITSKNVIENHKGPQPTIPLFMKDKSREEKMIPLGSNCDKTVHQENENGSHLPEGLENVNFFEN